MKIKSDQLITMPFGQQIYNIKFKRRPIKIKGIKIQKRIGYWINEIEKIIIVWDPEKFIKEFEKRYFIKDDRKK